MPEKMIRKEVVVNAPVKTVRDAWTTSRDAATFFAPRANITLEASGPYELFLTLTLQKAREEARV